MHRRSYLLFRGRHEVALIWKSLAENPLGSYHLYLYFLTSFRLTKKNWAQFFIVIDIMVIILSRQKSPNHNKKRRRVCKETNRSNGATKNGQMCARNTMMFQKECPFIIPQGSFCKKLQIMISYRNSTDLLQLEIFFQDVKFDWHILIAIWNYFNSIFCILLMTWPWYLWYAFYPLYFLLHHENYNRVSHCPTSQILWCPLSLLTYQILIRVSYINVWFLKDFSF